MHKGLRIVLNLLLLGVIIGFVWYTGATLRKGDALGGNSAETGQKEGVSPYKKVHTIKTKSGIISFDLADDFIYIAVNHAIMIYDRVGALVRQYPIGKEIRDIQVEGDRIYVLYPDEIEVLSLEGERITGWKARRINSDYCAMALSSEYIFVTDAGNKRICKYTLEGEFVAVILSPEGFIIPSYAFDIINLRDTIYCSNSGRHRIERYTIEGEYIDAFGKSGNEAGRFAGCCNPVYLAATSNGDILTSEKGNPRIGCFSRDGAFKAMLLGSKVLGGGTVAYRVKVKGDRLFIAGKNVLSEYIYDAQLAAQSACAGCPADCPLRRM